ncbi:hypothetical protein EKO23_00195 [Nocardioides guangzhouensis]|uniref:Protein kinase domain-containing protein n=1 Tax=Nocardioides guangzhouensis TaxID=2497878 RepID=A0A4V1Y038_9ACTN|nr:serine/threonine-protein kinase [Nocardioides guangzhouensis]RYP88899.1 hypothetical protein EKO23_00195 [Nocardioides guangzhouensis]
MTTSPQAPGPIRVGPYRLLTRLGEGGMGVVHLGQAADGRRLAVKVLRPHVVGDDEARARLAREVSSLSRVRSPRVAEIIDADPYGPIPYVATRYVPGPSLTDHVTEEGAISGPDLAWFARALGEALDAVHAAGVLHRDIKPSNVLMEGRTPILIDFGLARVADDVRLTRTGWLLGTPGYIAPEVLEGHDPGPSADVHGWAATVAYAGTGRPPFGRGPSMAVMDRVRRGQHDLAGLDPRLLPLVTRGLDPEPSRRPSLHEVLRSLGGVPTAPLAPPDEGPLTQPHDLEGLLWSLGPETTRRAGEALTAAAPTAEAPAVAAPEPVAAPPEPEPPIWRDQGWQDPTWDPDETAATTPGSFEPNATPYQQPPPADWEPQRTSATERLRRGLVGLGAIGAVAAGTAYAPYLTCVAVAVLVVGLRAISLTGSRATDRRVLRGTKWYDGVQTSLSAPWFLVASLPGSLLLLVYALSIAGSVALVSVAAGLRTVTALGAMGVLVGVLVWTGPGGSRVRSPLRRLGRSTARDPRVWVGVLFVLVLATCAGLAFAIDAGTDWTPAPDAPWQGDGWLGRHL